MLFFSFKERIKHSLIWMSITLSSLLLLKVYSKIWVWVTILDPTEGLPGAPIHVCECVDICVRNSSPNKDCFFQLWLNQRLTTMCRFTWMQTFPLHSHFPHLHSSYFSSEVVLLSSWSPQSKCFVWKKVKKIMLHSDFCFTFHLCGKRMTFM